MNWNILPIIWLCLAIAAIFGFLLGWLIKSFFCKKKYDEYEGRLRGNEDEMARLRASLGKTKGAADGENKKDDAEIASLKSKLTSLEADLKAKAGLDSDWKSKYAALDGELKASREKAAKLEADFSAKASGDSDLSAKYAALEGELKAARDKNSALEADLKSARDKHDSVAGELKTLAAMGGGAAAGAAGASMGGGADEAEIKRLREENAKLSQKFEDAEGERVYLLGQVKKAESGVSLKRDVPMDQRDDLELIHGVGPVIERMLYDRGIYYFEDVANWDDAKIEEISAELPQFKNRIRREGWVESARQEHIKKYGDKPAPRMSDDEKRAFASKAQSSGDGGDAAEMARLKGENASLSSKLEEIEAERAYLLDQVKKAEASGSIKREVPMDQRDDLELIHGVGPVIERMLYDMGIYFFKDVANWDDAKIEEVSAALPRFKDRIRREDWIGSAKEEHFKKYGERL